MDDRKYDFFAFISYKREDEKWAKWLQRKLEYYKLPSSVRKDNPDLPEKIRPVFKDTTDLEPGVLARKIQDALDSSKYLIVICSPRSANSVWVSKEVQAFIDSGRSDHIIPFIIGGIPNASDPKDECFPEGLRQLAGEQELLGANINEMGRDAAAIKVVARMFNLRFDTLWQRYERDKKRRQIGVLMLALLAIISAIAIGVLYFDRNKAYESLEIKNEELNNAYLDLEETNKSLSIANNRISDNIKAIDRKNDSLTIINARLIETNQALIYEKDKVVKKSKEIRLEQMNLIAAKAKSLINDGRYLTAYNYIRPYAIEIVNGNYPYSPHLASVLNMIKWHLASDGYKIVDRVERTDKGYGDTIFVDSELRYNLYASEGRFYLKDFRNQELRILPLVDRIESGIGVQFSPEQVLYYGNFKVGIWDLIRCTSLPLPKELDIEYYFSNSMESPLEQYYEYLAAYKLPAATEAAYVPITSCLKENESINQFIELMENKEELLKKQIIMSSTEKEFLLGDSLFSLRHIIPSYPIRLRNDFITQTHIMKKIKYRNNDWFLIDSKGNIELYIPDEIDGDNDSIMVKNKYSGEHSFITPFIAYNTGNGISYLETSFIINNNEILCVAGQGVHVVYNLRTGSYRTFQDCNIDSWIIGHIGVHLAGAFMFDENTLCDVRRCGQISLYDVNSGLIIDEIDIPKFGWLRNNSFVSNAYKIDGETIKLEFDNNEKICFKLSKLNSVKRDIEEIDEFWH